MFLFFCSCLVKFLPKPQAHLSLWPWFPKHSQTEPTPERNYQEGGPSTQGLQQDRLLCSRLTTPQPSCHST